MVQRQKTRFGLRWLLVLPFLGLLSCKDTSQSHLDSEYFTNGRSAGTGAVLALRGALDFEIPSGFSGPSGTDSGESTEQLNLANSADSTGAKATVAFQYSIVFTRPVASLEEIVAAKEQFAHVAHFNSFGVTHEPPDARVDFGTVGRPLYHRVTGECDESSTPACLRLVSGQGQIQDLSKVVILDFKFVDGRWVLARFNYFGAEQRDVNLPVREVRMDAYDGVQ